jgi:hypothetical protein
LILDIQGKREILEEHLCGVKTLPLAFFSYILCLKIHQVEILERLIARFRAIR